MAVDAQIPLSGIAPKLPSAGELVSLQSMIEQMRERKLRSDQQTAELASDKALEGLAAGLSAYYGAPQGTTEDQRKVMMRTAQREYFEQLDKSGQGRLYGWNSQKIQEFAHHEIEPERAEMILDQTAKYKDLVKHGRNLKYGQIEAGGEQAAPSPAQAAQGVPLAQMGQMPQPEPDASAYQAQIAAGGVKTQPLVETPYETRPMGTDMSVDADLPVKEVGGVKEVEAPNVGMDAAKEKPKETVGGLYKKADDADDKARQLRLRGGTEEAKVMDSKAQHYRTAAVQLETKDQGERKIEQGDRRLDQADEREKRLAAAKEGQDIRPEDAKRIAKQYLAGDRMAASGFARSQKNQATIQKAITDEAIDQGKGGKDIAAIQAEYHGLIAEESALGRRAAGISTAIKSAQSIAPMVEEASNKVSRTQFPTLNHLLAAWKKGTGDENVNNLAIAVNSFINVYARGINPTGQSTVSDKDHARELLSQYWSKGQITGGMKFMMKELEAESHAPGEVKQDVRQEFIEGQDKKKSGTYVKEKKAEPIKWDDLK